MMGRVMDSAMRLRYRNVWRAVTCGLCVWGAPRLRGGGGKWQKIPQASVLAGFLSLIVCGVTEIRTRDTLLGYTRFPGVPLQPLEHHSVIVATKVAIVF